VVLRRGAQQRGAADVDVLDRGRQVAVGPRDGLAERVEVDHHQVDRRDAVLGHDRVVGAAPAEDAAVHLRVQRLDAAAHHLGEAGVVGDLDHREARLGEQARGAAGGEQFDTARGQRLGEVDDAGLVGDAEQGAPDRVHG
jgi:hypothetical protein